MPDIVNGRELAAYIGSTYDDVMAWNRLGYIRGMRVKGKVFFNLAEAIDQIREHKARERQEAESREVATAC